VNRLFRRLNVPRFSSIPKLVGGMVPVNLPLFQAKVGIEPVNLLFLSDKAVKIRHLLKLLGMVSRETIIANP
jgi:hypothetical protein